MTRTRAAHIVWLAAAITGAGLAMDVRAAGAQPPPSEASPRSRAAATPAATIAQIAVLVERQQLADAQIAVRAALQMYPSDGAVHNLAGVITAQQGDSAAAETCFREAIRLAPAAVPFHLNLGRLYQERVGRDSDAAGQALRVYREILRLDPAHTEALYQAAFLTALGGAFAESRAMLGRLPAELQSRPQVLALLATNLAGVGDSAGADTVAATLAAHADLTELDVIGVLPAFEHVRHERIERQLLEALEHRGLASAEAQHRLGIIALGAGDADAARRVLERAFAGRPGVPVLMDLSRAAYRQRDLKGALGYLAHARDLEPSNAGVHFFFGIVCVDLDLGAEAYASLKRAVTLDPQNAYINYALGAVSIHRHEPSGALPYFETYVRLKPADPRGRFALGAAHFYSNRLDAARPELEHATRHAETAAGAHYFLGRIARQLNDLSTARRELDRALLASPAHADAWAELGLVHLRAGEFAAAEASIAKALEIDADNYAAAVNLATLYGRTRDPRREAQAARLAAMQDKRAVRAQEFLRIVEVVP